MKIVIAASEVVPFAKTGGLADVAGALPLALEELNQEVIVVMPKYKAIQDSKFNPSTALTSVPSALRVDTSVRGRIDGESFDYAQDGSPKDGELVEPRSRTIKTQKYVRRYG